MAESNCTVPSVIPKHFELERCCQFINNGGFKRVALQFPLDLLKFAVAITHELQSNTTSNVFIIADSPYHTCCIDEIQAEKLKCDSFIHYGNACFSRESALPTLYIFNELEFDHLPLVTLVHSIFENKDTAILLFYCTNYSKLAGKLYSALKPGFSNLECSQLISENIKESITHVNEVCFGRSFSLRFPRDSFSILFIGEENRTCLNFRLAFHLNQFYILSPDSHSIRKLGSEDRLLKKRYHLMQKVSDAAIVGILIANMWLCDYLQVLSDIKSILRNRGKEYYTISMGNIQPTKLANFLEVDIFVLLGCPENVILDSSEYYKPIITPYELFLSLTDSHCSVITDNYRNDINSSLAHFSSLRTKENGLTNNDTPPGTEIQVKYDYVVQESGANDAALYLKERSWQGLDRAVGDNTSAAPALVELGKSGIPISYSSEESTSID